MPLLDAQNLARTYGVRTVLGDVSLTLNEGDRVGLVGINGSGKSTLARILAGLEEPDAGAVVRQRDARVAYLPQEPRFEGRPTALEAALGGLAAWRDARQRHDEASERLAAGDDLETWTAAQAEAAAAIERAGGWDLEHRAAAMLSRVGVPDPTRRVDTMSGGERRRVDLARLLVTRPDLAILDEPTNHLDVETIEWLETHLATQPGALFVITHDRAFLDQVATRTAELEGGVLHLYEGGYAAYLEAKAEREAHADRHERNRQNLLRRELEWLRRSPAARTSKQKARVKRAEDTIAQTGPAAQRSARLHVQTARSGKTVLDLEDLRVEVEGRALVDGLTLTLTPGERVGIVGPNGCGKTTLLRAVLGEHAAASGEVRLGKNAKVTYFGQRREGLDEDATVLENVAGGRLRVAIGERTMDARAYLERFLFDHDQMKQPVASLSGGEKARALLAKLLLTPTNLLVMDEPTNDLDVATLSALEELLVELDGTALIVTHDRWFLDRIATAILAFEGDGRVVRYAGGYHDYRQQRAARPEPEAAPEPAAPKKAAATPKKKSGLTYAERIELEGMMDRIGEAEETVGALEEKLADPTLYQERPEDAAGLAAELDDKKQALERLMARWEALEEKKAGA